MVVYKNLSKIDKKKFLRADERRRRAGDIEGEVGDYLSESSESGSESNGDGSGNESDSEEDENGELVTPELDAQIMKALAALRSKDKSIYNSDVNFFSKDAIKKSQDAWAAKQKLAKSKDSGKMTMTDYQHKVMMEHGGLVDEAGELNKVDQGMTHVQEQEALKDAFKKAAIFSDESGEEDAGDGEFLIKKQKTDEEVAQEEIDYRKFMLESIGSDVENKVAFENWATRLTDSEKPNAKDNADNDQAFLMDYILNRGWVDKSAENQTAEMEAKAIVDNEEDARDVEFAENFESKYNFRYEEEGANQIKSFAREIEGSVRRKDDRRKLARERAKERKEQLKKEKAEELKRIKNKKKREILEKLKEIQGITGNKKIGIDELDLDKDLAPEEVDELIDNLVDGDSCTYDENGKPVWSDDIDIDDLVSDGEKNSKSKEKPSKAVDIGDDDFIMDADYLDGAKSSAVPRKELGVKKSELKEKVSSYMDQYYQLGFDDIIGGDLPTRFKYSKVKQVDYGLTPAEILLADDRILNEYFSVKKIATYRPDEKIENDLALYAKGSRMKYIKKKAQKSRAEWMEQLANLPEKSSGKKRRAKPEADAAAAKGDIDKDRSAKKSKKKSKAEKDKKDKKETTKNVIIEKPQPSSTPIQKTSKISSADDDAAAAKIKKLNRRQRQKAKKLGAVAESTA
ncbi:Kinetochore protein Spc24 [Coemansia sp. RSA 1646]|nr:Kinetochore protein Spc24 [Coemansia sp. RSA 1646]KAJ2091296.1 Ribosome biogenesis protein Kri1 [Coemansia sp. RSA 986]